MRVCFVCPGAASIFFPELPPSHGGAEAQLSWFARELGRREGFEVHFVVRGKRGRPAVDREGVRVHFIDHRAGLAAKLGLQRLLSRIGADVYVQQGIGSLTKEIAFFCRRRRRKFVYWLASTIDVDPTVEGLGVTRGKWFEWGMLKADLILAQTRWQMDKLKENYGRDSALIPNALPARPETQTGKDKILWIGRFAPVKQPELFIELAKRLPEEKFLLIGPVSSEASRRIFEKCKPLMDRTANLDYNAGVPLDETQTFFDNARLFVNTSISEGFPNTFVQAAWGATPIASLNFDPDGIIARNDLGVAPAADLEAFAKAIGELLGDGERLARCGANARAHAAQHHDIVRNTDTLAEELRKL